MEVIESTDRGEFTGQDAESGPEHSWSLTFSSWMLKTSSTTQQKPLNQQVTTDFAITESKELYDPGGPEKHLSEWQALCVTNSQSYEANSVNSNAPWLEQSLLLIPNILKGAGCRGRGGGQSWSSASRLSQGSTWWASGSYLEGNLVTVFRTPVHEQLLLLGLF